MSELQFRKVIQALLPDGVIWNAVEDGDFEKINDGIAENVESVYNFLKKLSSIRDPFTTLLLSDLEKEYGVVSDSNITEEERRAALAAIKYAKPGSASFTNLQSILREAGFDVTVYPNNPPVDPATLLDEGFQMVAGGDLAFAGDPEAYAGLSGGYLLVNGENYFSTIRYDMEANGASAFAGEPTAVAGYFLGIDQDPFEYEIPVSSERWHYIFFIGGDVYGWIPLNDWNMEKPNTEDWNPESKTTIAKDDTIKESGTKSLKVVAVNQPIEEQLIFPSQPDPSLVKAYGLREVIGGFTYPDNYWNALVDGDMERSGVGLWTAINGAVLSKQTTNPYSGKQLLRIAYGGVPNPYAYDSQAPFTIGKVYRVIGVARSDGTAIPEVYHPPTTPIWTGTNSTAWQQFDITFTATSILGSIGTAIAAAGYVEFDDILIHELPSFVDGNMETSGVASWLVGNSAILTKNKEFPRSGSAALRVRYNGVANPYAYQNAFDIHLGANDFPYKVSGWARSVDGSLPTVSIGSLLVWTGSASTNWQYFEFTRLASSVEIRLGTTGLVVEFDDIEISPVLGAVGTVTGTSFAQTALGPARNFNGSSDFVTGASHIGILGYELDSQFTLSAWVKIDPGNPTGSIISRNSIGSTQWDFVVTVPGTIYFEWSGGNASNGVAVNDGLLHHVAVIIDGANSQHYLDGEPVGSTFNPTITKQAVATLFGAYNAGAGRFFDGVMISPQIYSEAKDAAWIASEYQAGLDAQLKGSYAEQLITTDEVALPVDGFAWSDGIDAVPCVGILDAIDDTWKIIWVGHSSSTLKQTIAASISAGIKGIRLYNKFSINGEVNFDDISIIDPVIEYAQVPSSMEGVLKKIVMKYKPLHSWAGLLIDFT